MRNVRNERFAYKMYMRLNVVTRIREVWSVVTGRCVDSQGSSSLSLISRHWALCG